MALGKKTGGRKKGTPNKATAELKDAILSAFDSVGGSTYLVEVAKEHPQVFCTLLSKVLPKDIVADVNLAAPTNLRVEIVRAENIDTGKA